MITPSTQQDVIRPLLRDDRWGPFQVKIFPTLLIVLP